MKCILSSNFGIHENLSIKELNKRNKNKGITYYVYLHILRNPKYLNKQANPTSIFHANLHYFMINGTFCISGVLFKNYPYYQIELTLKEILF